jgi:hypothetical protein
MTLRDGHFAPVQGREAVAKLNDRPISALTMRLSRSGGLSTAPYQFDLIGGKGGTRTLDPGIMSCELHRRATEIKRLPALNAWR